ncbi:hypothetical protein MSG28_002240 [Choristoneura fumiferana]|uniref:Uncharacterized protein n=1 Tax=Choristoneura fumiferana TaxID=7141 RepID=A0ACC0JV50_CHOFU|nr:hypothetical protein MSG28_002240 [Choristoneura fumiferana]
MRRLRCTSEASAGAGAEVARALHRLAFALWRAVFHLQWGYTRACARTRSRSAPDTPPRRPMTRAVSAPATPASAFTREQEHKPFNMLHIATLPSQVIFDKYRIVLDKVRSAIWRLNSDQDRDAISDGSIVEAEPEALLRVRLRLRSVCVTFTSYVALAPTTSKYIHAD